MGTLHPIPFYQTSLNRGFLILQKPGYYCIVKTVTLGGMNNISEIHTSGSLHVDPIGVQYGTLQRIGRFCFLSNVSYK